MTGTSFNKIEFDQCWQELAEELSSIESQYGLGKVIETLHRNQLDRGFIKDDLEYLERFHFYHPEDSNRFFSVQYNPNRMKRFGGANQPPPGFTEMHGNCVLCKENIGWQQNGKELGYDFSVNETAYTLLMNPFPLMSMHALIATQAHMPQSWMIDEDVNEGFTIEKIMQDILEISYKLPEHIVFYNGINAGASIPSHFHLHVFKRPSSQQYYPIEQTSKKKIKEGYYQVLDYPINAQYWHGEKDSLYQEANDWIQAWLNKNLTQSARLSANIISSFNARNNELELYFIPRDQERASSSAMRGIIGGLEVLGELVFITEEEKTKLDAGEVDYHHIENILSCVRPHEDIHV